MPPITEDTLRHELDFLAPAPPPDLLALSAVGRAIGRRRRRRRTVAVAAGVVVVAVAIAGPGLVRHERRTDILTPQAPPAPEQTTDPPTMPPTTAAPPAPAPAEAPPATTATTATTAPSGAGEGAAGGPRVRFANATFALPAGWAVIRHTDSSMCVAPEGNPTPRWDGCSGLALAHGDLPGFEMEPYEDHGPWAWYHHTDVQPCPTDPDPAPGTPLDGVQGAAPGAEQYAPVDRGFRDVGPRVAVYDRWAARCELSGFTFEPRAWHLPASQIVIFDVLSRPEAEAILASFRFD